MLWLRNLKKLQSIVVKNYKSTSRYILVQLTTQPYCETTSENLFIVLYQTRDAL